jgi:hypothetical protein
MEPNELARLAHAGLFVEARFPADHPDLPHGHGICQARKDGVLGKGCDLWLTTPLVSPSGVAHLCGPAEKIAQFVSAWGEACVAKAYVISGPRLWLFYRNSRWVVSDAQMCFPGGWRSSFERESATLAEAIDTVLRCFRV